MAKNPPGDMFLLQSVSPCGRIGINSGSPGVASWDFKRRKWKLSPPHWRLKCTRMRGLFLYLRCETGSSRSFSAVAEFKLRNASCAPCALCPGSGRDVMHLQNCGKLASPLLSCILALSIGASPGTNAGAASQSVAEERSARVASRPVAREARANVYEAKRETVLEGTVVSYTENSQSAPSDPVLFTMSVAAEKPLITSAADDAELAPLAAISSDGDGHSMALPASRS